MKHSKHLESASRLQVAGEDHTTACNYHDDNNVISVFVLSGVISKLGQRWSDILVHCEADARYTADEFKNKGRCITHCCCQPVETESVVVRPGRSCSPPSPKTNMKCGSVRQGSGDTEEARAVQEVVWVCHRRITD